MKNILIILFILLCVNIKSQSIISKDNIKAVNIKKDKYYKKCFKTLLNDIKIEIKSVGYTRESENNANEVILRFDDRKEYNALRNKGVNPAKIIVVFIPDEDTNKFFQNKKQYGIIEQSEEVRQFLRNIEHLKIFSVEGNNPQ